MNATGIEVIDRQELATLQKSSLIDVLRTVPGIMVNQQGGAGGIGSVSIRGGEPNFAVVMLDGVPLNDPTNSRGGSFEFSSLNVNAIERFEILRGPQTAVYGSDALSGVINIITATPTKERAGTLHLGLGDHGYRSAYFLHSGPWRSIGYAFTIGRSDSGEQVEGSTRRTTDFTAKLTTKMTNGTRIDAGWRYVDGDRTSFPEQSGGPLHAVGRLLDQNSGSDSSGYLSISRQWGGRWSSRLRFDHFGRDSRFESPGVAPFGQVPPNGDQSNFRPISRPQPANDP